MFINKIYNSLLLTKKQVKIVFPEGTNPKIQAAAKILADGGVVKPILLFPKKTDLPSNINSYQTIAIEESNLGELANVLFELRKAKGLTLEAAHQLVKRPNYFGTMLVKTGQVDGEVCGIDFSTKDTLLPALQIIKTTPTSKLVSSVFIMTKKDEIKLFTDCALNIEPTAQDLFYIAKNVVKFSQDILEIKKNYLALLSYSSANSGIGPSVEKVQQTHQMLKGEQTNVTSIYGDIQFDAAYDLNVARKKIPSLNWDQPANIFVFPTLNAANIGYKIAQRMGGYSAIGPIMLGLAAPVNDLSRGASIADVINVSYLTAAQFLLSKEVK